MDDASAILSDHVFDNSHYVIVTRVNEHAICPRFRKTSRQGKIGAKIVQCELGRSQMSGPLISNNNPSYINGNEKINK